MISLLYLDGIKPAEKPIFPETNKLLDLFAKFAIPNIKAQKILCDIVSNPLIDAKSIQYRQEILQDFIQDPNLFTELCRYFGRIFDFHEEYQETRRKFFKISVQANNEVYSARSGHIMQANAFLLKRLLLVIQQANDLCKSSEYRSQGMKILSERLNTIVDSSAFERLQKKVNLLVSYVPTKAIFTFSEKLDPYGKIVENRIILLDHIQEIQKDTARHRFWSKKDPATEKNNMPLKIPAGKLYENEKLLNDAFTDINSALETVIAQITSEMVGIHKDLLFYSCAYRVYEAFCKAGVTVCFPNFTDETKVVDLVDPILTLERGGKNIVVNNFSFTNQQKGLLITGENGSGKTVYLSSILLLYLLAQSGLMVPAKQASLKIKECFGLFMATSEIDQKTDSPVGRFEEETKRISEDIDRLVPGSLYFLNEPFQTTTDAVGSQSMADILLYLTSQDIEWVVVSHLTSLIDSLYNAPIRHVVCDHDHVINDVKQI